MNYYTFHSRINPQDVKTITADTVHHAWKSLKLYYGGTSVEWRLIDIN